MSARGRLATPIPTLNISRGITDTPGGTRLATPLSPHMTGVRRRAGGDGDGGTAVWNMPSSTTTTRPTARLEKPTIASTLRAASNRNKVLAQKAATPRKARPIFGGAGGRKFTDRLPTMPDSRQPERSWPQRKPAGGVPLPKKDKLGEVQKEAGTEKQPTTAAVVRYLETGTQTNEAEILNRDLLVGDIKLLMPSVQLAEKIDKRRKETKVNFERQTLRKFARHEQDQEQHLDELKEFMERSYVTKRKPKKPPSNLLPSLDPDHYMNAFKSMDEFFTREVPKSESITNIKERIKRKEQELMSMFEDVDVKDKNESEFDGE